MNWKVSTINQQSSERIGRVNIQYRQQWIWPFSWHRFDFEKFFTSTRIKSVALIAIIRTHAIARTIPPTSKAILIRRQNNSESGRLFKLIDRNFHILVRRPSSNNPNLRPARVSVQCYCRGSAFWDWPVWLPHPQTMYSQIRFWCASIAA